jgi:hypothetical protein
MASVNPVYLGEYLDRGSAMARVAEDKERGMELVLHDWALYQVAKPSR